MNSRNSDFEVQKKSLEYKVGSPKVESRALTIEETPWDTEVKESSPLNKEVEGPCKRFGRNEH